MNKQQVLQIHTEALYKAIFDNYEGHRTDINVTKAAITQGLDEIFEMGKDSAPKSKRVRRMPSKEEMEEKERQWELRDQIDGKNNLFYRFLESGFERLVTTGFIENISNPHYLWQKQIGDFIDVCRTMAEMANDNRFSMPEK